MQVLLTIIVILVLPFAEHLFFSMGLFSLFAVIGIYLFKKIPLRDFLIGITIFSLVLDVTMHLGLGSYMLSLGISILLYSIMESVFPEQNTSSKVFLLFFTFWLQYVLLIAITFFGQSGSFTGLMEELGSSNSFGRAFIISLFELGVYFLLSQAYEFTRGDSRSDIKFK